MAYFARSMITSCACALVLTTRLWAAESPTLLISGLNSPYLKQLVLAWSENIFTSPQEGLLLRETPDSLQFKISPSLSANDVKSRKVPWVEFTIVSNTPNLWQWEVRAYKRPGELGLPLLPFNPDETWLAKWPKGVPKTDLKTEQEPNDDPLHANPGEGGWLAGQLMNRNDKDFFIFPATGEPMEVVLLWLQAMDKMVPELKIWDAHWKIIGRALPSSNGHQKLIIPTSAKGPFTISVSDRIGYIPQEPGRIVPLSYLLKVQ